MDGDGQNDPADIPKLLKYFTNPNLVILGHRMKRMIINSEGYLQKSVIPFVGGS